MTTHRKFSKSGPIVNILNVKNNTKPFFSQYLCISFACRACPPKMMCYWFYLWAKIITTNFLETLTNVNFSILFEFPAWVHWHISISMTLLLAWSKMDYVIYLAQCPGLSQRPSPFREQPGFFLVPLIKMVLSFNHASFITPKRNFFWML